jgi:hypothetical protein
MEMHMNRSLTLMVASTLFAAATGAQAQDRTAQFVDRDGTRVTVTSGQPAPDRPMPPPPFAQLDADRDGSISRNEAEAYTPLLNDYDHVTFPHKPRLTQAMYDQWVRTQGH